MDKHHLKKNSNVDRLGHATTGDPCCRVNGVEPAPKPMAVVPQAIEYLQLQISVLEKAATGLTDGLYTAGVLSNEESRIDSAVPPDGVSAVPMAARIAGLTERVMAVSDLINDAAYRLEI